MNKWIAAFVSFALAGVSLGPAIASDYLVSQKTLSPFSSSGTSLSASQKAQVKAAVEENPSAEKFICTGIRFESAPASENIKVRARAKAACDYAKQLNPDLSTFYQNKPTKAASYAGKVLLTIKSPEGAASVALNGFVKVDALVKPSYRLVEGESCQGGIHGSPVLGTLNNGDFGFLECYQLRILRKSDRAFEIDQKTLMPKVPVKVPEKTTFAHSPMVYITPDVVSSVPKTEISSAALFDDMTQCTLAEADNDWPGRPHMVSGFPMAKNRALMDGEIVVQVIPVDFADYRSSANPAKDFVDATKAISDFWSRMSDGKTKLTLRVPSSYSNLPNDLKSYNLASRFPNFDGAAYSRYVSAAVAASDSEIDFSGADVVIIAHTPFVPQNSVGTFIAEAGMPGSSLVAKTKEKTVYNTMIQGGDWPRNIQNWIHEFGHMLGLTDAGGEGNMGFDVMLWYGNPELTIWNRFVLGVVGEKHIDCKTDRSTSTHLLAPVAWPGERTEGLVIPLSKNKALVVESRRRTGYDALLGKESEGALVYTVDTSRSGNFDDGPFQVVGPDRMKLVSSGVGMDAPLKQGESITHSGWKITNVESGAFGDVVKVEKVG